VVKIFGKSGPRTVAIDRLLMIGCQKSQPSPPATFLQYQYRRFARRAVAVCWLTRIEAGDAVEMNSLRSIYAPSRVVRGSQPCRGGCRERFIGAPCMSVRRSLARPDLNTTWHLTRPDPTADPTARPRRLVENDRSLARW